MEELLDNIGTCGDGSKPSGLAQGFLLMDVPGFHIFDRILHGRQQGRFGESCRRFGLACVDGDR